MFVFLKPSGGFLCTQNKNRTPEWKLDCTGSRCEQHEGKDIETLARSMAGETETGGKGLPGKCPQYFRGGRGAWKLKAGGKNGGRDTMIR